jgi:UDP-N-acetylmuramoylalanine--D-glutamate ligase
MKLLGEHNAVNAAIAALAAKQAGATINGIRKALKTFKSLENRLEPVGTKKGVTFINDTCATTPDGAIAALEALSDWFDHLWFIMGGQDKELLYEDLGKKFAKKKNRIDVFLLPGSASEKMEKVLKNNKIGFENVVTMKDAVSRAKALAVSGDAIVLSPAAASFGMFKNEFDRGGRFKKAAL